MAELKLSVVLSPETTAKLPREGRVTEHQLRHAFAEVDAERAGLVAIGLHDARHTFASLMIAAGVNAKALSTYMGHASVTITYDRYGHLMPGNEGDAAALLDAYLTRADTAARVAQVCG